MSYENQLQTIGLSREQALVYETLLDRGTSTARSIVQKTGLKRGMAYKTLEQLEEMELVTKHEKEGSITKFSPADPHNLENLLRDKEQEIEHAKNTLDSTLGSLVSDFNLLSGKPNVQFYEGRQAIEKITGDFPKHDHEIRQWVDISAALREIKQETLSYLDKRVQKNISKRMLLSYSKDNIEYAKKGSKLTEFRMLEQGELPTAVQTYDATVTMITLTPDKQIGLKIEDRDIAETMQTIFDAQWYHARDPLSFQPPQNTT